MRNIQIFLMLAALVAIGYTLTASLAFAQEQPKSLFGNVCDPKLPPGQPGACDLGAFLEFVRNIINYLLMIAIPLGVLFVAYGGFVIMTAGGSEEKVKKGKQVITAAVIGIAIAFGSWLIIFTVNQILKGF